MKYYVIALLLITTLFFSCSETVSPPRDATEISILQMINDVNAYPWFNAEYNNYQPDAAKLPEIKNLFEPDSFKVIYFFRLNCSCTNQEKDIPDLVKILKMAQIPDSCSEIWSMSSDNSNHPYKSVLHPFVLPGIHVFKNGLPIYSVKDTLSAHLSVKDTLKLENVMIQALGM